MRLVRLMVTAGLALGLALQASAADQPLLVEADGTPVSWGDWLRDEGPVAILVWASWAPRAGEVLARWPAIARRAQSRGFTPQLVAVQETLDEASHALADFPGKWKHDRHGSLLKHCRVIRVPSLVLVSREGQVVARLKPDLEVFEKWKDGS